MNEEPELGTTMDDQIDRFKRSHAAQIRRYDLKMRKMYVVTGYLLAGRGMGEGRVEGDGNVSGMIRLAWRSQPLSRTTCLSLTLCSCAFCVRTSLNLSPPPLQAQS